MNSWIDFKAVWEIVVIGLLAGAGLPALFAVGMRVLGSGSTDGLIGRNPAAIAIAVLSFAIVAAAVGYGIYIIVASGHK